MKRQLSDIDRSEAFGGRPELTIAIPLFNEVDVLEQFHVRLKAALASIDDPGCRERAEILYVDDGSTDASPRVLEAIRDADPAVGVIRLSRNFGKEQAMCAGLAHARGQAVILIDADLQDPPECIPDMVAAWKQGVDVVNMRRSAREGETWFKRATAHCFYRLINRLSEIPIPEDVGDFRLLSRRALDALNRMPERNRFLKGMFAWVGFKQVTLEYRRDCRAAGHSKWRYWRLWNFALEGVTSFTTGPLKVASYLGLMSAFGAFVYGLYFLVKTLLLGDPVTGFPTLIITLLFMGGLQLMALGILGEYLGRLVIESRQRPLYFVDRHSPPRTEIAHVHAKTRRLDPGHRRREAAVAGGDPAHRYD